LTNLLPEIWDHDNSTKRKEQNNEAKGLITKCRRINLKKKNQFSIKDFPVGRQPWKNNKVKYSTVKQFKTQTMQTRHGIKKWKKIIRG
jgi:hypothetical protein